LLVIGGRERTFFFFFEEIIKLLGQIKRKRENRDAVGWDSLSRFYAIYLFLIFFSVSLPLCCLSSLYSFWQARGVLGRGEWMVWIS